MKIKYKEEILKEADEKVCYLHIIRLKVDSSTENMKPWNAILKIEATANLEFPTHLKSSQNEHEI